MLPRWISPWTYVDCKGQRHDVAVPHKVYFSLAEAEQEQHHPPKVESSGSNPECESNVPSPNGDGSRLMSGPNVGSSPTGTIVGL